MLNFSILKIFEIEKIPESHKISSLILTIKTFKEFEIPMPEKTKKRIKTHSKE